MENIDQDMKLPIRMTSIIVKGFGRGSKDLGIPTANISRDDIKCKVNFDSLPTGIYWGWARTSSSSPSLPADDGALKAAISIGYNPYYGNKEKTVEPHLIAPEGHALRSASICGETQFPDLYGETIRLSIVGYLRPELPFEGLDKLTLAIKNDITQTEGLCDSDNELAVVEKKWVESSNDI